MTPEFTLYFNLGFFVVIISVVYFIISKPFSSPKGDKQDLDVWSRYLILIGLILIVFSFIAPSLILGFLRDGQGSVINNDRGHDGLYSVSGTLDDTIGGIMNPFIAMAGVIFRKIMHRLFS